MGLKRIIIVGAGSIGLRHARICRRFESLQAEVCDPRPEALAEAVSQLGELPAWPSFEAAAASGPYAMIVATPHRLHAEMTCAALRRGAHVLCEKPMSDTNEGARMMAEAARETGRVCRVGFMLRFHPAVVALRSAWQSGALGKVAFARYHAGALETLENSRSRYQGSQPGALVMDYAHGLDLLTWLCGQEPERVYARGICAGAFALKADPNFVSAVLDFPGPVLAEAHFDYATKPALHELHVIGDEASARVDLMRATLELRAHRKNLVEERPFAFQRDDLYAAQLADFLAACAGAPDRCCSPDEGIRSTGVMGLILRSIERGERIAPEALRPQNALVAH